MRIHAIVNHSAEGAPMPWPPRTPSADPVAPDSAPAQSWQDHEAESSTRMTTATFITPQSLVAFPFASTLVAGIWTASHSLLHKLGDSPWTGLTIAMLVGSIVYGLSVSDRRVKLSAREKLVGLGIAIVNCFYLYMAALAIKTGG